MDTAPPVALAPYSPQYQFAPENLEFAVPVRVEIAYSVRSRAHEVALYWSDGAWFRIAGHGGVDGYVSASVKRLGRGFSGNPNPCSQDLKSDDDNCGSCGRSCNSRSGVTSCRDGAHGDD